MANSMAIELRSVGSVNALRVVWGGQKVLSCAMTYAGLSGPLQDTETDQASIGRGLSRAYLVARGRSNNKSVTSE